MRRVIPVCHLFVAYFAFSFPKHTARSLVAFFIPSVQRLVAALVGTQDRSEGADFVMKWQVFELDRIFATALDVITARDLEL